MIFALFGITNDGLNLAVNLLVFFLVVIWLALVYWTYADARRRIDDPMLVACATASSLFPFIGTIVYAIVRPPEFLDDARERELEIRSAEARMHMLENDPGTSGQSEARHSHLPFVCQFVPCASASARRKDEAGSGVSIREWRIRCG